MGIGEEHVLANLKKCLVYKNGVYAYYLGIKSPLITLNFMKPVLEPDHLQLYKYKYT